MLYTLKKSNRKSVSISITPQLEIVVRAPKKISQTWLNQLLESKKAWIEKHLQKQNLRKRQLLELQNSSVVVIFGEKYNLKFSETNSAFIKNDDLFLPLSGSAKDNLAKFYKDILRRYLKDRLLIFAEKMNLQFSGWKITSATTRLGSCNSKKRLCFSYHCASLPKHIIDYIIVHELAHLQELNHSVRFWKLVELYYPNFQEAKKYIKSRHTN